MAIKKELLRVGITYDLRQDYLAQGFSEEETAEFDRIDTIQAIEQALEDLGFKTDRIGTIFNLTKRIADGKSWDLVFNIAEGLKGFAREAQVPALLDAFNIPYTFSDPLVLSLALHKALTKRVMRDLGIPTPDFFVVENHSDIDLVNLPFPLFAKPIAEGTGKGITPLSKIESPHELEKVCTNLLINYNQPVLLETFLPGREFTVGILGTGNEAEAIGTLEIVLREQAEPTAYSYVNKERCEDLVEYRMVNESLSRKAQEIALKAWQGLGCRDAGRVDLKVDSHGTPNLIEVNPLAGLHPAHSDLPILCRAVGISYRHLIGRIMASALKRAKSLFAEPVKQLSFKKYSETLNPLKLVS
jgi:D-alanine-D-alanine ligase